MRDKMRLILDTGQLMMQSGADTERVVRYMLRAAAYLGIYWNKIQLHLTYSTIMLNIDYQEKSYTMFRKCYRHGSNMETILAVSDLGWQVIREQFSLESYRKKLSLIISRHAVKRYSNFLVSAAAGLACACFCILFGGNMMTAVATAVASCIGWWVNYFLCEKMEVNGYLGIASASCVATLLSFKSDVIFPDISVEHAMMSCSLFLIPGISLINAVNDFMHNYLTSGVTRTMHTVLIILSMTFGMAFAIWLCHDTLSSLSILPDELNGVGLAAAALSAICFSIIFNVPPRLLFLAATGAVITVGIYNLLIVFVHWQVVEATFAGASVLSILCFWLSKLFHIPAFIINIPSVIPLIPGVLLYRLLFSVINVNALTGAALLQAIQNGVQAVLVLIAIAVGVTLPDVIGHQFIERTRQKEITVLLHLTNRKQENDSD